MPRPARALLFAPLFVLAACATHSSASSTPAGAMRMSSGPMSSDATHRVLPASARMICSDDIKAKVRQALQLPTAPATHDTWDGGAYTCRYALPMGEMTLSDQVFPDAATARARIAAQEALDGSARPLSGLGQQAYGSDRGLAVVLKDDQILTVDTTGLPERFGANDQRRTDLAYEVASDVLGCWTGDE
jgi:hypothetical protein